MRRFLRAVGFVLGLGLTGAAVPADVVLPPDWVQLGTRGVDVAASADGQRWMVGADGRAYRWTDASQSWAAYGSRTDLARIDAAPNGAAAITRTGELVVTDLGGQWRPTGVRASDVGLGGGRLWLAGARLPNGEVGVLLAPFDPAAAALQWRTVPGRIERVDVDPQGRAWGLDREGRLYVHDGNNWIEDARAPAASDVGAGPRGEIVVVARQVDAAQGGGTLHARDPGTGEWRQIPGRLASVSVDRDGHAFGTNTLSWVLSSTGVAPGQSAASVTSAQQPAVAAGEITLGELAGTLNKLPDGLAPAVVKIASGDPKVLTAVVIGETQLNGLAATVARVPTAVPGLAMLLVGHRTLALGDYLTGLQGTAAADLRLTSPVFAFVPKGVTSASITAAQAAGLGPRFGRKDLAGFRVAPGASLLATLDLSASAEGTAMARAMGFDPADLALVAKDLDAAFFVDVAPSDVRVTGVGARALGDLSARYGTTFAQGLEFRAPASALDRKRFGPAMLKDPTWSLVIGRPGAGKLAGVEVAEAKNELAPVLSLDTTLALDLRVPDPETVPQGPGTRAPAAPKTSVETLETKGARVTLDFTARTVKVVARVAREGASTLASLKGFKLEDARLAGAVKLPASPGLPEAVDLKLNGKGELPSAARASQKVDMEVALVLDEARTGLIPTATVTGNLTLADLVGNVVPGLSGIRLTRVELSRDYLAGTMMLYGLPVRAVRYQSPSMSEPVIGIQHRELNLTSVIPKLRDTPLGSFGLVNTTIFVRSDAASGVLKFEDRKGLPKELAALIDPKAIADDFVFPLELRPGVNLVGQYGPREAEAAAAATILLAQLNVPQPNAPRLDVPSPNVPLPDASMLRAPNAADVANARKVLAAFGIKERAYPVKANFRASAMRNASYEESAAGGEQGERDGAQPGAGQGSQRGARSGSRGTTVTARDVACGANAALGGAAKVGIDPVTGLDLAFAIPDFKPPYAGDQLSFANTRFTLKEIDGQVEPALVTSMGIRLPRAVAGIESIGLGTKIRVQGDLDVLCRGVKPDSNVEVQFAGSTALNYVGASNAAFAALAKVAELTPLDPKLACEAKPAPRPAVPPNLPPAAARVATAINAAVDREGAKANLGWKNAFGLPFLEIRKFSASGTFVQKDGKRSLVGTAWTESRLGSQLADVTGSLTLEAEPGSSEFKVADWLWRVPGPVQLDGLPGVKALAGATPVLDLGDLRACNLEVTPKVSRGTLASVSRKVTGNVVLAVDGNDLAIYAGVDRLAANMLLKKDARLPAFPGDTALGRTFVAIRNGATTQAKVADLPGPAGELLVQAIGDLAGGETTIPLVKGVAIAGRLSPKEIPDRPETAGARDFFDLLEVADPIPVFAGIEVGGGNRRFAETLIASLTVPGLPDGRVTLRDLRVSLANLEGGSADATSVVLFEPPKALARATEGPFRLEGRLQFRRPSPTERTLGIAATSNLSWTPNLGLAELAFRNLGLELESKRAGTQRSKSVTLVADADFRGLAARARLGLTSDGSSRRGTLLELVAQKEGERVSLDSLVHALPLVPKGYAFLDVAQYLKLSARGVLVAKEAGSGRVTLAAEDVEGTVNGQSFKGQLAIAGVSGANPVLFIANDERWTPLRVFPAAIPKGPFADLPLPEGLVMLSPSKGDANLTELHPRIYEKVFPKLLGSQEAASVVASEGLTVLGRLDLARDAPPALMPVARWIPAGGMLVGAGIDPASNALAFYADVQGFKLNVPSPIDTFVKSAGGHVTVFFKVAGEGTEAGLSTNVSLGLPRLDQPGTMQPVDATLSVSSKAAAGASPAVLVSASVPGTWNEPGGLQGFSLQDTNVQIGTNANGAVVNLATNRAEFQESNGKRTRFAFDLQSAWAGGLPTQLATQFAKSPDTAELVVTPNLQVELANSVLQLALKSGSALYSSVSKRLEGAPGSDAATRSALTQAADVIGKTAGGATSLMRNSPLAMIGVRNPQVFFATPGNDLPDRPGVERPPLGLGLAAKGQMILVAGSKSINLADGVYRINLLEGYHVSGKVTPPAPFSGSTFSVSGSQPLFSLVPNALVLDGRIELPGSKFAGVLDASLSGRFSFTKPLGPDADVDVAARVSVGGLASRDAYFTVRSDSVRIYSAPDGGCTDVPLKLNGTVSAGSLDNPAALLGIASLDVPDPVKCAGQVGGAIVDAGKAVGEGVVTGGKEVVRFFNRIGSSPPRASYDCANLRDEAFGAEYPPGRIWIARDEYTRGASSGAYARYIFSEAEQKFRPFGAKGALGGTACGGLIGVEGVGLGRFAADDELWSKALTCNFIPPDMKGAGVYTAGECYAARGLTRKHPGLAGSMVVAAGDNSKTTSIITPDGVARRVGGGNDWRAYNECQLNEHQYRVYTLSLHEIYQIETGPAVASGAECRTALGPHWKEFRHARTGQFVVYGDEYKNVNLVLANGTKRWIGNKDNWTVFNACGLQEKNLTYVSAAEDRAIPGVAPIGSGDECRQLFLELNPPSERDRLRAEMDRAIAERVAANAKRQADSLKKFMNSLPKKR